MTEWFSGVFDGLFTWLGDFGSTIMNFFNDVLEWLKTIGDAVLLLLPDSPFMFLRDDKWNEILGYVNFFLPVREILIVLSGWIACVIVYYTYQAILRMTNHVG